MKRLGIRYKSYDFPIGKSAEEIGKRLISILKKHDLNTVAEIKLTPDAIKVTLISLYYTSKGKWTKIV